MVLSLETLQDLEQHTRTAGLISKSIQILVRFRKIPKLTVQHLQSVRKLHTVVVHPSLDFIV